MIAQNPEPHSPAPAPTPDAPALTAEAPAFTALRAEVLWCTACDAAMACRLLALMDGTERYYCTRCDAELGSRTVTAPCVTPDAPALTAEAPPLSPEEAWEALDLAQQRALILARVPWQQWLDDEYLSVLMVYCTTSVAWAQIKARYKVLGGNPWDLEQIARDIRAAAKQTTAQAAAQPAAPTGTPPTTADNDYPYSDAYNAWCLVQAYHQDLRYCFAWKSWLVWTGTHWERDTTGQVLRWMRQTVKALGSQLAGMADDAAKTLMAHIKSSLNTGRLEAAMRQAQSWEGISVAPEVFDGNPWLLNCTNGTLDLQTGTLRPHAQADRLTKCLAIPYDEDATCPQWHAFLWRAQGGTPPAKDMTPEGSFAQWEVQYEDAQSSAAPMVAFLQRAIGYSLTGSTREQCLFILHGPTKTGKSTFLSTLRALLGPYGMQADMESFMHKEQSEVRNDLADMAGSRLICALESHEGRRLNISLVKQLTGGTDRVKARFLFQEYFEFAPQFKVFLGTNHLPKIPDSDAAIWERIRRVPFVVEIPKAERNKTLDEQLHQELPGILAWAVRGCLAWQAAQDLQEPQAVLDATAAYRTEMNTVARFLEECCTLGDPALVKFKASVLASAYVAWCKRQGEPPLTNRQWIAELETLGYARKQETGNHWYWCGISLANTVDDPF